MQFPALSWEDMLKWSKAKIGQKVIGQATSLRKPRVIPGTLVNFLIVYICLQIVILFQEQKGTG